MKVTEERTIDGVKCTVTQFPASEGVAIMIKLTKIIGPLLSSTLSKSGSISNIMDIDLKNMDGAVTVLLGSLSESEFDVFVKRLLKHTLLDGQSVTDTFDIVFQGKYGLLFKVLKFVMEVNYKDFLAEIGLEKIMSKSQTLSTVESVN